MVSYIGFNCYMVLGLPSGTDSKEFACFAWYLTVYKTFSSFLTERVLKLCEKGGSPILQLKTYEAQK